MPKTILLRTYLAAAGVSAVDTVSHTEQLSHDAVLTNVSWRSPSLSLASPGTVAPAQQTLHLICERRYHCSGRQCCMTATTMWYISIFSYHTTNSCTANNTGTDHFQKPATNNGRCIYKHADKSRDLTQLPLQPITVLAYATDEWSTILWNCTELAEMLFFRQEDDYSLCELDPAIVPWISRPKWLAGKKGKPGYIPKCCPTHVDSILCCSIFSDWRINNN